MTDAGAQLEGAVREILEKAIADTGEALMQTFMKSVTEEVKQRGSWQITEAFVVAIVKSLNELFRQPAEDAIKVWVSENRERLIGMFVVTIQNTLEKTVTAIIERQAKLITARILNDVGVRYEKQDLD